jgi:hypothetical protein
MSNRRGGRGLSILRNCSIEPIGAYVEAHHTPFNDIGLFPAARLVIEKVTGG